MAGAARLGPFEVHAPLARGGMGEVWRGRHVGSGVRVAIKVLTEDATRLEELRMRMGNEAKQVPETMTIESSVLNSLLAQISKLEKAAGKTSEKCGAGAIWPPAKRTFAPSARRTATPAPRL